MGQASGPVDRRHCVLIGAAAYAYAMGSQDGEPVRDGVLWQLGVRRGDYDGCGREPGIAQEMIQALRHIGVLGEPVWTTVGAVLHYQDSPCRDCAGVPVTINGTWFNLLKATSKQKYETMGDVPLTVREKAKDRVAELAQTAWPGLVLSTTVNADNRVVTHTSQGNLFGVFRISWGTGNPCGCPTLGRHKASPYIWCQPPEFPKGPCSVSFTVTMNCWRSNTTNGRWPGRWRWMGTCERYCVPPLLKSFILFFNRGRNGC